MEGGFRFAFMSQSVSEGGKTQEPDTIQDEDGDQLQLYMPAKELRPDSRENMSEAELVHLPEGLTLLKGRVHSREAAELLQDERVLESDLVRGLESDANTTA